MKRMFRTRAATAVVAATVSILALTMFPGLATADLATTQGGSPSAVFMQTSVGQCLAGPQEVAVTETSHLLVYFTGQWVGLGAHEQGLMWFDFDEMPMPFDWLFSGEKAPNDQNTVTVMWSFEDVAPGTHLVGPRFRVVSLPENKGGETTADLHHCAFTVFVIPAG